MRRALLTATLLLCLLAPAAAGAATTHVVRGAGFGHGIGMSQYGAYGLAQHGWDYKRILAHYYSGTRIGQAPGRPVRVLLQASDPYVRFQGATRAPGGLRLEASVLHVVRPASGGRLALYGRGGKRLGTFSAPLRVSRAGGGPVRLMGRAINGVTSGRYRGAFDLYAGSAGGVTVVNALPIDDYVQGVVAGEVPSSWDEQVLRAQAVTARTYALATRKTGDIFDQYPDTRSQMYIGVGGETSRTNAAVRETAGETVTYQGEIATTFYFSTSGGRTENIEYSFLGAPPKPWLKSVEDPYDSISPRHRWSLRFSNARMGALLGSPGTLRRVQVLQRGKSPRIVRARVYGSLGSRVLTGAQIRARLGLYDSWAYFGKARTARASRSSNRR
ncbi:MAG TPA: SpoIID/LytB domain-containing protein [Thermoleophilaceae bacterium]|nr:SpoIID/LytB domain-containing protein [Thermoleophilaceae bacterium]